MQTTANCQVGCPIRRSGDQSLFSASPGLSQSITSFIASCCLGIHQTPLSRLIRSGRRKTPKGPTSSVPKASHLFPATTRVDAPGSNECLSKRRAWRLISVLDLDNAAVGTAAPKDSHHHIQHQDMADYAFSLLNDVKRLPKAAQTSDWTGRGATSAPLPVKSFIKWSFDEAVALSAHGELVEPTGFEPVTLCLQSRCSTN